MDCQQILELNTSSANEVAESDLKNIYPQTCTEAKGNIKFELCKEWIALIHKTCNGKSVEICLDYGQSFFSLFQTQLKASLVAFNDEKSHDMTEYQSLRSLPGDKIHFYPTLAQI